MSDVQTQIPAVPVLVPLVAVLMVAAWFTMRDRLLTAWAAVFYLAGVIGVTLLPLQIATGRYANTVAWYEKANLIPIITIDVVTFTLNIVLTLPLGFLLPMLVPSLRHRADAIKRIALISLAFSATVEVIQYATNILVSSGRMADTNDLIANTLGGVLGYLVWRAIQRVRTPAVSH